MIPRLYQRLVSRCQTINQLNRLHISLENRLTPDELNELLLAYPVSEAGLFSLLWYREQAVKAQRMLKRILPRKKNKKPKRLPAQVLEWSKDSTLPDQSFTWLSQLYTWFNLRGQADPEHFRRQKLLSDVTLYSTGGNTATKTLLICVTGKEGRMMMPLPIFLQNLDANAFDVIVMKDLTRNQYRYGLSSLGSDLFSMIREFGESINLNAYRTTTLLGVSAGGLPAIAIGLSLGFDRVVSVAPRSPDDPVWVSYGDESGMPGWFKRIAGQEIATEVLLVYGADYEEDRVAAEAIQNYFGDSTLVEITGKNASRKVSHNILYQALNQGMLHDFLLNFTQPTCVNKVSSRQPQRKITYRI